jgi:hypothetical protein
MEYTTLPVLSYFIDQTREKAMINIMLFTQLNEWKIEYLLRTIIISILNWNNHVWCLFLLFFVYIYIIRSHLLSLSFSILPSSRLKLALVKFFLTTIISYNVCSKIDLGIASLQSTNKEREKRKKKRLKRVTCLPHPHTRDERRLTQIN